MSLGIIHVNIVPTFKPGDQPPDGYIAWHEWAKVQSNAGYRQRRCSECGKWRFPQEQCEHAKEAKP